MKKPHTQAYFIEVIKRSILTSIKKQQVLKDALIAQSGEFNILKIPYVFDLVHLTDEFIPYIESHQALINTYEVYAKLGCNIDEIIKLCLPILEKEKQIEEERQASMIYVTTNSEPFVEEKPAFEIYKPFFVNEEMYESYIKEWIWGEESRNLTQEKFTLRGIDLLEKYYNEGLFDINSFVSSYGNIIISADKTEYSEEQDSEMIDKQFSLYKAFLNEELYDCFKAEMVDLIKNEIIPIATSDNIAEVFFYYSRKEIIILHKYIDLNDIETQGEPAKEVEISMEETDRFPIEETNELDADDIIIDKCLDKII